MTACDLRGLPTRGVGGCVRPCLLPISRSRRRSQESGHTGTGGQRIDKKPRAPAERPKRLRLRDTQHAAPQQPAEAEVKKLGSKKLGSGLDYLQFGHKNSWFRICRRVPHISEQE